MTETVTRVSSSAETPLSRETPFLSERSRFHIRRLLTYGGQEEKSKVFNNGDPDQIKYAVPFQLRQGSQLSGEGGFQLAFAADPDNKNRIVISEDVRSAGGKAVILEQRDGQLFVKVGNIPYQIHEGSTVKPSLTEADFATKSLVIPIEGSKYSLAVIGFDGVKQVVVQKVVQAKDVEPTGPVELVTSYAFAKPSEKLSFNGKTSLYDLLDRMYPLVMGPVKKPIIDLPSGSVVTGTSESGLLYPTGSGLKPATYTAALTVSPKEERVPGGTIDTPEEELVLAESVEATFDVEMEERAGRLRNTNWARILRGAILVGLLSIPGSSTPNRNVEIPALSKESSPERSKEVVIETNLNSQSSWGVFLHHLGKVDSSKIADVFPSGIPDDLIKAWDAVREVELQTGQFIEPDDPLLLDAVQAAADFFGAPNLERLYRDSQGGISRVNVGLSIPFAADPSIKTEERFGQPITITDSKYIIDSLGMPTIESTIRETFGAK